jgi:dihydropyrimidinase
VVSTTPARLFGLFPRKGTIAVGSDADLVIFDPTREETISAKTHHMRVDYSMFEGIRVKGLPRQVLVGGKLTIDQGRFVGRTGQGRFLKRERYSGM